MLVVHSWLQDYLAKRLSARAAVEAMEKAGIEVESLTAQAADTVINAKTAANRSDLQSYIGLAREVAVHSGSRLKLESSSSLPQPAKPSLFSIKSKQLVPRYCLIKLKLNRPIGPSPAWLAKRLRLSGLRPLNLVVDATNYYTLAYGQSMHAFDGDKIRGKMVIRLARSGEKLRTLDGVMRQLEPSDLVIADDSGVIDLAGVMGGASTEISNTTKTIFLTIPNFDPTHVRKTALRLGMRTEASARFERGVPIELVPLAAAAAVKLLDKHGGVGIEQIEEEINHRVKSTQIKVSAERLSELVGIPISKQQVLTSLRKLDFKAGQGRAEITAVPPYWRADVKLEEDVLEEVLKIVGLDKVPAQLPPWQPKQVTADRHWPMVWQLRAILSGLGMQEVINYPFVSSQQIAGFGYNLEQHLKLKNPMSEQQTHLRTALAHNLVQSVADNARQGGNFSLFEMGRVFGKSPAKSGMPMETERYAVVARDAKSAYPLVKNALDQIAERFKLDIRLAPTTALVYLHPARKAEIRIGKEIVGYIGELNPKLASQLKIKGSVAYLEGWIDALQLYGKDPQFLPLSRFPQVTRDITINLPASVSWQDVKQLIDSSQMAVAQYVDDYYSKNGERDLTLRVRITPKDKTLTESEISAQVERVVQLLAKRFKARLKD